MTTVYKIVSADAWKAAEQPGVFAGSEVDARDGFIHLSTPSQVRRTAELHFKGQDDLVLVVVDTARLGAALRFEPARSSDLFPHLYGPLPLSSVLSVQPLPLDAQDAYWNKAKAGERK